jgi:hypothetical protein
MRKFFQMTLLYIACSMVGTGFVWLAFQSHGAHVEERGDTGHSGPVEGMEYPH